MLKQKNRGITLIALIITIIVMLILVAVTINVALDTGLFGTAKKSAYQTEVSTIKEQLEIAKATKVAENGGEEPSDYGLTLNDLNISDELKNKYGSKLIVSEDGTLYYDSRVVTDEEERIWLEEIGINEYTGEEDSDLTKLKKYFLGENLTGRNMYELMNYTETGEIIFKDESETIANASTTLSFLISEENEDETKSYLYTKYKDVAYKIVCNYDTKITESIEEIYIPQGNEGEDLGELTGISEYNGWKILYDYGNGTVEAVAPKVMGDLTLGYKDETAQTPGDIDEDGTSNSSIDKAIYSYNNAITRINEYCKNLEDLPTNEGVRSVGAA